MSEEANPDSLELEPAEGEYLLVQDGDCLAVIGDPSAVEWFLRKEGLWERSSTLGLSWFRELLKFGADSAQELSHLASHSGRWVKLTEESAAVVKKHSLMTSKTPGVRWLMAGQPGEIRKWLSTETSDFVSATTNPESWKGLSTLLSNAAGAMAQLERKQEVRQITDLLVSIDGKLDDVRRAQRDAVLAKLDGVTFAIDEAMKIRETTGHVSIPSWSKVQHLTAAIAEIESNALRELDALARSASTAAKPKEFAKASAEASSAVDLWLSVLARCFQLHEEAAILELDHVQEVAPADLDGHRMALHQSRDGLRDRIARITLGLIQQLDKAAVEVDVDLLLHTRSVRAAIASSNQVGESVVSFHEPLGIESERVELEATRLRSAIVNPRHLKVAAKEAGKMTAVGVGGAVAAGGALLVGRTAKDRIS